MKRTLPSPELVRELLRYDKETGLLYWQPRIPEHYAHLPEKARDPATRQWNSIFAGIEALTASSAKGYRSGAIMAAKVKAHSVVVAIMTGAWPEGEVDHIDGDPGNNRWANLRQVSHAENGKNQARMKNNRSGVNGVHQDAVTGRWMARGCVDYRDTYLGTFDTKDEAIAARHAFDTAHGFHQNHGRAPVAPTIVEREHVQGSKLTIANRVEIAFSEEPTQALAKRFRVHRSTIIKVRSDGIQMRREHNLAIANFIDNHADRLAAAGEGETAAVVRGLASSVKAGLAV